MRRNVPESRYAEECWRRREYQRIMTCHRDLLHGDSEGVVGVED